MDKKHWLIRINDGINFKNSKHPFWGVKSSGGLKTIVRKIKEGDILWFFTSKKYGSKCIAMTEYLNFYDRTDEPLLQINTLTNEEQGWVGNHDWCIQIHYKNLYTTERQNILICIQCAGNILEYITFRDRVEDDLLQHYDNFKFYAEFQK